MSSNQQTNLYSLTSSGTDETYYCTSDLWFNAERTSNSETGSRLGLYRDNFACCKTPTALDGVGLGSVASGRYENSASRGGSGPVFFAAKVYVVPAPYEVTLALSIASNSTEFLYDGEAWTVTAATTYSGSGNMVT